MGRPSLYTPELASEICARIAEGASVRKVCLADDMPSTTAVFKWLGQHPKFAEQYARACSDRREVRKEQLLDIPLDADIDPQRARLLSDNIKWVLAKEEPKKYGDRVAVEASVRRADDLTDDELAALASGSRTAATQGD
jgi:hypothetical protein